MNHIGDFPAGHTNVCIGFASFAGGTGASSATSGFAASDVLIYKGNSTTQRSSSAGITVAADFDSLVGINMIKIDLSDNTDAGFYAAGFEYTVVVSDVTIDSQTVRFVAGSFSIERAGGVLSLARDIITTLNYGVIDAGTAQSATATTLVMRAGASFGDNAIVGSQVRILSATTGAGQQRTIESNVGSTDTLTVDAWTIALTGPITYAILGAAPGSSSALTSISAAVWDRQRSSSVASGSFGQGVASVQGNVTGSVASVTGNVAGSVASVGALTLAGIAAQVWNEPKSSHTTASTYGVYLDSAVSGVSSGGVSAGAIAAAVWNELLASHTTANSAGAALTSVLTQAGLIPGTTDGKTFAEITKLTAAVLLGRASGMDTTTAVFRAIDNSKARVTATVDEVGNRTNVVMDAT